MGLDITFYRNARLAPDAERDEDGFPKDYEAKLVLVRLNDNFPGRGDDLQDRQIYSYDEAVGFRAGSYGGYNQWREELAELAGYPAMAGADPEAALYAVWEGAATEGPFFELINFSDCEGVIGPRTSAKLAADFKQFRPKADALGGWFAEQYARWQTAFETAADNGLVDFPLMRALHTYRTGIVFSLGDSVDAVQHDVDLTIRFKVSPGCEPTREQPGEGPSVEMVDAFIKRAGDTLAHRAPGWLWPFLEKDEELERELLADAAAADEAARDQVADMRREERRMEV